MTILLTALVGALVGFAAGVFGVGGGFLLVPILNIALKVPIEVAIGSTACQVLGPATTSLLARKIGGEELRLPLIVGGGLLVGVILGTQVLELGKSYGEINLPSRSVPWTEFCVLIIYFLLLVLLGIWTLWESGQPANGNRKGWLAAVMIPPYCSLPVMRRARASILVLAWFGLIIGFMSGLLGISGGLILLPGLVYLFGFRTQDSIVSSMTIVWLLSIQSTIAHAWHENVEIGLVLALLVGGTTGARLGSEIGMKLKGRQLRKGFAWLLLGTALLIAGRLGKLLLV